MTPEHIQTSYADLLDGRPDRATLALLGDLDVLYAPPVPARASVPFARLLAQRSGATDARFVLPRSDSRGVPHGDVPRIKDRHPRPSRLRQWLAFAAAALAFVLVGLVLVLVFRDQGRDDGPRTAAPIPPATTATAREILYVSQDDGTDRPLRAVRSDGAGSRLVTGGSGEMLWWPAWSPGGQRIAFSSSMDGPFSIYTTNAAGGDLQRLTMPELKTADSDPVWSPDGARIAFLRSPIDPNVSDLMVMNADGTGLLNLTNLPAGQAAATPAWSPDGTRIAVALQPGPVDAFRAAIVVVNADGSGQTRLADDEQWNFAPAWSPDGTRIAFVHSAGGTLDPSHVFVVDSAGGQPRRITTGDGWAGAPDWSSDGAWIAYVDSTETRHSIRVVRPDGTDQQEIAAFDGEQGPFGPRWSPDGQQIAYMDVAGDPNARAARATLVVMDRDGANRRVLAEDAAIGAQPAWSPVAIDAGDATPEASPTALPPAATIEDMFLAALDALSPDERGCAATPATRDDTMETIQGRLLVGQGTMQVFAMRGGDEGGNHLVAGDLGIVLVAMPESGIARLQVSAEDVATGEQLAPNWGPQVGEASWIDAPVWRTLFTFPHSGCWQLNVVGEDSAGVAWLRVDPAAAGDATPAPATLDDLRPLEPGEGWFVRYQVWSDLRQDEGALMHWTIVRTERITPDGARQQHVTAWDEAGAIIAELVSDGERWWWNQRGWVEAGSHTAGIAPLPLELSAGMFEPETVYQTLTTLDPGTAEHLTDGDVAITRLHRDAGELAQRMGLSATDAYYEVRQAADPPGAVLATRWVIVDDTGVEIELSRHMLEHLVRTDAATMDDAEFAVPGVPTDPRPMRYAPPADPLPTGFAIDRHWSDYPVGIEHLAITGPGVALDVAVSASRGGHDPRQLAWNAARAGNSVYTIDSDAAPVTYLTKQGSSTPFLAVWDDGRYRFELSATSSDAAGWGDATLLALVEALSNTER